MSTFVSITKLAKDILERFQDPKVAHIIFSSKDAQFNSEYNQNIIIPILMSIDGKKYDNAQINELFQYENKVKITFSQNDKKKVQKFSSFNMITIDLTSEKSFIDKSTKKTINYFTWSLTKYNNTKAVQKAYNDMNKNNNDDDPFADEIEDLPDDMI